MNRAIRSMRSALLIAAAGSLAVACGDGSQQMDAQTEQPGAEQTMPAESGNAMQSARDETTMEDVKSETRDLMATIADYGADQRQEFTAEVGQALNAMDQRIETIETRAKRDWENLGDVTRTKYEAMLDKLHEKREAVADSYERIENDSDAAWDELKTGFSKAWNDVVVAVEQAEDEFGNNS